MRATQHRERRRVVVIGSGPNGLVAANLLADVGWQVQVLEAESTPGGAVRSDQGVVDGFVHDTFSSFYPLAAASSVITGLGLESYGLTWTHAPAVLGHPLRDGSWGLLQRSVEDTAAGLDALAPGDGDAWRQLHDEWQVIGPSLVSALLTPFPPVRAGLRTLPALARLGGLSYVRELLTPILSIAERRFSSEAARLLLVGNALHADLPLSAPGSGVFGLLMAMLGHTVGWPVPRGGAQMLTDALVKRLVERGGVVRCGAPVARILITDGRVGGVRLDDGEQLDADVVVADVAAPALYGELISLDELPARTRRGMAQFELDPATIKVDWALSGPIPWSSPPEHTPGTVHIGESTGALVMTQAQILAGQIPAHPFLLTGQMTSTDPTRSPRGTESFWAYTHVPQHARGDAGDGKITGTWDSADAERMADRMQAEIELYAPDFASRVLARRVLGPHELEARNRNLINGALGGGTASLHQELFFRPIPGAGRAETPIRGVFLASASAHPGGGVHGAPGANAARAAIWASRLRRL